MTKNRMIRVEGKPSWGKGSLKTIIKYKKTALKITGTLFGSVLDLEDAYISGEPGTPGFPMQVLRLALPPFSDVTDIQVAVKKKVTVTRKPVLVAPIQEPQPGSPAKPRRQRVSDPLDVDDVDDLPYIRATRGVTLPRLEEYRRILSNPEPVVRVASVEHRGTATILTLEARPVRQNKKGLLELATEIEVSLSYEPTTDPKDGKPFLGSRVFKRARTRSEAKRINKILLAEVINPDWVFEAGDLLYDYPVNVLAQYDYLVITDNYQWDSTTKERGDFVGDLVTIFERLADWKKRRGLTARVITITDIMNDAYGDFKTGTRDLQEVIRNFIKWAYSQWCVSWVLLGGDVSIVPVRIAAGNKCCRIAVESKDPPDANTSYWTGSYLKMHVTDDIESGWPGSWPLLLVNRGTGELIPQNKTGQPDIDHPNWYYTTDYVMPTNNRTEYVRVDGPGTVINAELQWLYEKNLVPTDLYYSSLQGSSYGLVGQHDWDLNNNQVYGQSISGNVDGVEYSASIGLGRAPVASATEAETFVNKVIAYEQFRQPDGTVLDLNWPRRLTMVSSNWARKTKIYPSSSTPPGNNKYYYNSTDSYTLIKLKETVSDIQVQLIAVLSDADDIRVIPYDPNAENTGRGWYFAVSDIDLSVSEQLVSYYGVWMPFPKPTLWVVVYSDSGEELMPLRYYFDLLAADGSMTNQETLRKQIQSDFPSINIVKRLYEDEFDLPQADATSPSIDHLTADDLCATLNLGQHFVSLSGHGHPGGCCRLKTDLAKSLTNEYHTFIAYADACSTNAFEQNTMSEELLKNPNGGAVAYIGNTRFSWIAMGDDFQREFFTRLKATRHLSDLNDSRFNISGEKWIKLSLNLLGDPEMPVWVGKPSAMKVTHPSKISKIHQHVCVKVTTPSGTAIPDAVVSFAMNNRVVSATTDAAGEADLQFTPPATGTLEVVATAQDHVPYFGTIIVDEQTVCQPAVVCGAQVMYGPSDICNSAIVCTASIHSYDTPVLCEPKIITCSKKIACNLAISGGCKVGIGGGCPAIDPLDWGDPIDILVECHVKTIKELAAKRNTQRVKKVIEKLSPANRKALTLMLKRISKE